MPAPTRASALSNETNNALPCQSLGQIVGARAVDPHLSPRFHLARTELGVLLLACPHVVPTILSRILHVHATASLCKS